ncbi:MAG: 30S ribosomal protein S17 [Phycisphaera sp.]|nr:MAG: 30S ribosomal protein S17 [Phycisphaera sp.]
MSEQATSDSKAKTRQGTVESDKRDKSRRVVVNFMTKHPKYGKFVKGRTILQVHDENNESKKGDLVEVRECKPVSKTKSWELVRVISSADLA